MILFHRYSDVDDIMLVTDVKFLLNIFEMLMVNAYVKKMENKGGKIMSATNIWNRHQHFRHAGVTNIRHKHRCSQSDFIKLKSKYIHNMHCNHIITSTISINGHIMFLDSKNAWLAHFRNTDYKKPKK